MKKNRKLKSIYGLIAGTVACATCCSIVPFLISNQSDKKETTPVVNSSEKFTTAVSDTNVDSFSISASEVFNGATGGTLNCIHISTGVESFIVIVSCANMIVGENLELKGGFTADGASNCYVTRISEACFKNQTNIKKIDLTNMKTEDGGDVEAIMDYVFIGCTNLTSVTLPSGLVTLGVGAFTSCSALEEANNLVNTSITNVSASVFSGCSSLKSITLPATVTAIQAQAFYNCTSLNSFVFPVNNNFHLIGSEAFYECDSLHVFNITNAANVLTIGDSAFRGVEVTSYSIPNDVTNLQVLELGPDSNKGYVLVDPQTLTSDGKWSASTTAIGALAYGYIDLSDSQITSIVKDAFYNCDGITGLKLPSTIESIGENAFTFCDKLATVDFSNATCLITIDNAAFAYCSVLASIDLTNCTSLTSINRGAFGDCPLTTLIFPNGNNLKNLGLTFIGNDDASLVIDKIVFNCSVLPTNVDSSAFSLVKSITEMQFPNAVFNDDLANTLASWGLTSSKVTTADSEYSSTGTYVIADGWTAGTVKVALDLDTTNTYSIISSNNLTITNTLTFGSSVNTINAQAFAQQAWLTAAVEIPSTLTTIGANAFNGCNLTSVTFDSTTIPTGFAANSFQNCGSNTKFYIPYINTAKDAGAQLKAYIQAIANWTGITDPNVYMKSNPSHWIDGSFKADTGDLLVQATIDGDKVVKTITDGTSVKGNNIEIKEGSVDAIAAGAFANNKSISGNLVIPASVTTVGANAFSGCYFSWTFIVYNEVSSVWQEPTIGNDAFAYTGTTAANIVAPAGDYNTFLTISNIGTWGLSTDTTVTHGYTTDGTQLFKNNNVTGFFVIKNANATGIEIEHASAVKGTNLSFNDNVTLIDSNAFYDTDGIYGSLTFPYNTVVQTNAFDDCDNINTLYLEGSPGNYKDDAFKSMDALDYIFVDQNDGTQWPNAIANPEGFIQTILGMGIKSTVKLGSYDEPAHNCIASGLSSYEQWLDVYFDFADDKYSIINGTKISGTDIVINDKVIGLEDSCFADNTNISGSFTIDSSVRTLGYDIFENCSNINKIYLNWSVDQVNNLVNAHTINVNWLQWLKENVDSLVVMVPQGTLTTYKNNAQALGLEGVKIQQPTTPTDNKLALVLALSIGLGVPVCFGSMYGIMYLVTKDSKPSAKKRSGNKKKVKI